jgi:protein-disulfide isomerase
MLTGPRALALIAAVAAAINAMAVVAIYRSNVGLDERLSKIEAASSATSSVHGGNAGVGPRTNSGPSLIINDTPSLGSAAAEVVVIEFADFLCPYCREYANQTFPVVRRELVETGQVQYLFKQLPLERLHPRTSRWSIAAECAFEQGKFWELHEALFHMTPAVRDAQVDVADLGVSWPKFEACSEGGLVWTRLDRDAADAVRLRITATPTFLFAKRSGASQVKVIRRMSGAQSYEAFADSVASVRLAK